MIGMSTTVGPMTQQDFSPGARPTTWRTKVRKQRAGLGYVIGTRLPVSVC
jgi:hypothetical protein